MKSYSNPYAPIVVVGGDERSFGIFAEAYARDADLNRIHTPMCLLRRFSTLLPVAAVFLPGFAVESLHEAVARGVSCLVFVEHKTGNEYQEHPDVHWYFSAPNIPETKLPFCTLVAFAEEVRRMVFGTTIRKRA